MSKLLYTIGNAALYSSALSSLVYVKENEKWSL